MKMNKYTLTLIYLLLSIVLIMFLLYLSEIENKATMEVHKKHLTKIENYAKINNVNRY